MKNAKKTIVTVSFLMAVMLLGIGTVAYFRRTVNGNITGNAGNLVLIVNEKNAVAEEDFRVSINRSENEPYVYPGDSGTFNINLDSTGSTSDVDITVTLLKTNIPDNLKFYLDENHTEEFYKKVYKIEKSDSMTKTIPVYWYWDGSKDDFNDSVYMGKLLEANVLVSATSSIERPFIDYLKSNATLDTNVNFYEPFSETNGQGIMMMSGTQNDTNPILYYRGTVLNNNMIFGDLCWLIVRTTETGGIKLLYNGEVNEDGSCNIYSSAGFPSNILPNMDLAPFIATSAYTDISISGSNSIAIGTITDVGYMFNNEEDYHFYDPQNLSSIKYKEHVSDNTIDSETGRHKQNLVDSTVKTIVDSWYVNNIKDRSFERLLEDTVWCNDRSIISEDFNVDNYPNNRILYFAPATRNETEKSGPSLSCTRDMDKFTVSNQNGNGDLTYPVGLLTADEIVLAGAAPTTYIDVISTISQGSYHTMSPHSVQGDPLIFIMEPGTFGGIETTGSEGLFAGVRPVISVQLGSIMPIGDGTMATPYRID